MAFAFFRRHQKMVMIIMIGLMVVFLIQMGLMGNKSWLSGSRDRTLGKTTFGEIRASDENRAAAEWRMLEQVLRDPTAPEGMEFMRSPTGTGMEFQMLDRLRDRDQTYLMLLQEADHNGVRVGDPDIDSFLAMLDLTETNYESYLDQRIRQQGFTETQFRTAIRDWLAIHKMFATSVVLTPPSEREASYFCRDLREKVDLRVLAFSADKYLEEVPAAVDSNQVQEQFARLRNMAPGQYSDDNPFGFGYHQPDRIQISYAFLSRPVIERAVPPTREDVDSYYTDVKNSGKFLRMTQPSSAPGVRPAAGESNGLVLGRMSLEEAAPRITQEVTARKAGEKTHELAARFRDLLRAVPANTPATAVYQTAWEKMLLPREANIALDVTIDTSSIGSMRLDSAVDQLALKVQQIDPNLLSAIVFPWGQHEKKSLSPDIVVKLEGTMTLREALRKVCEEAQWPPIEWGMCAGFDKVLFPLSGAGAADFFPIVVRTTGLMDIFEYRKDNLLGGTAAQPPTRQNVLTLASQAFMAKPFQRPPQAGERMEEGQDGNVMTVWRNASGEFVPGGAGTLLWRLLRAAPGQAPKDLTDEIRPQVEKDIRLKKAFELAYQRADKIRTVEQFDVADANADANAVNTGPFPRRMLTREAGFQWAVPPVLGLPPVESIHKSFIDIAFSLAPGPTEGATIGLFKLPALREVLILKRVNFSPVTRDEYVGQDRLNIIELLFQGQNQLCRQVWFTPGAIQQRVGWVQDPGTKSKTAEPAEPAEGD